MKVGDVVKVDYVSAVGGHWNWVGMLMGIYGHKLEFMMENPNVMGAVWALFDGLVVLVPLMVGFVTARSSALSARW